jgi:D-sedoheptulose 7-phosphate isomerase
MPLDYFKDEIQEAIAVKQAIAADHLFLRTIEDIAQTCAWALKLRSKIILVGNGGSAADAQHLAAEFVGRYKTDRRALPALALTTDSSVLTAISNDYGYENVFTRQLEAIGNAGDVFFGISTSGYSINILKALKLAQDMGLVTVGLTGSASGAPIRDLSCDYCLNVPSTDTARIQECHIMIGHIICGYIERTMFPGRAA